MDLPKGGIRFPEQRCLASRKFGPQVCVTSWSPVSLPCPISPESGCLMGPARMAPPLSHVPGRYTAQGLPGLP